jgi:O-Antigen ligase
MANLSVHLAAVLGAAGAVLVLVSERRAALIGGFAALAAAEVGFAIGTSDDAVRSLIGATGAAIVLAGLLVTAGLAALFIRYPALVLPVALAAAPFRLPLDFDPTHRFYVAVAGNGELGRLLPLYTILAAAVVALLVRCLRESAVSALPPELSLPAAAFLGVACISTLWTSDVDAAANRIAFFLLPFAALVAVVARTPFPAWMPRALAGTAVGLGVLFAGVGLWQAGARELFFFSQSLEVSNTYTPFFRVTSLFRDPSLYGRHIVLGISIVLVALWLRRVNVAVAVALIAFMWAGLYYSYSQSSLASLFAVALALPAAAGTPRARRVIALTAAGALLVGALFVAYEVRDESARRATGDRSRRAELALRVFADHPVVGAGLGSQPRESQQLDDRPAQEERYVSHTTPLTVAAELGVIGLALYAALLVGAVRLVQRVYRDAPALGLSLAAALLALFVHSLFYSGFFEDPLTWLALAIAASYLGARAYATEPAVLRPAPGVS